MKVSDLRDVLKPGTEMLINFFDKYFRIEEKV